MAEKVIMPKAGMAMETGTIIAWLKEVGDPVSVGEPLLEIETDKTTMQVESMSQGTLLCKLHQAGEVVPVVTTIGYIGAKGEPVPTKDNNTGTPHSTAPTGAKGEPAPAGDNSTGAPHPTAPQGNPQPTGAGPSGTVPSGADKAPTPAGAGGPPPQRPVDAPPHPTPFQNEPPMFASALGNHDESRRKTIPATPLARTRARALGVTLSHIPPTGAPLRARDIESFAATRKPAPKATPLASRMARRQGVDLTAVQGSGHGGKIFSRDLPDPAQTRSTSGPIPLSAMRKTIANRMLQAHLEIPPVTLHTAANVTRLSALRQELNACGGIRISFNDLVLKAAATALSEHPAVNASFTPDGIRRHQSVHIGIAVALEDGLIVPVLQNADTYPMGRLSQAAHDLAARARQGGLRPEECAGATFTISNLGMFGITAFTPIINPPESCILGVCAIRDQVVPDEDGGITNRKEMGLSLTFDHRCLDGANSAKFLQRIVALLENPAELLL